MRILNTTAHRPTTQRQLDKKAENERAVKEWYRQRRLAKQLMKRGY